MKTFMKNGNGANRTRKSEKAGRRSPIPCAFEPLEARQLFSVTGFSLVDLSSFPGAGTTVINQPTIFQSTLQSSWQSLISGKTTIGGQTLDQEIASNIQAAEHKLGLDAYDISSSFDGTPAYNGSLHLTSSGAELELTFDAIGNQTTFTSTTNSILGSWADPTFHVTYNLDLTVDLSLPSNPVTGKVTATANAAVSNVNVTTKNVIVGLLGDLGVVNIPQEIAKDVDGFHENLSSIVPTGLLTTAVQTEAAQGYTHLSYGLNSGGNLLVTAQKPTLTINGSANDHISISSGSNSSVVITASGQTETFAGGFLKTIVVNNNGSGTDTLSIPSLPSGIAVQVTDSLGTDSVVVGGTGSLASVAGTVSVSNSSSNTTLTVNDSNDPSTSNLKVTSNAVQFNGRNVVTYSAGKGDTSLKVESGAHGSNITVAGTASGVPTTIQTGSGSDNYVTIDGSSSAVTDIGFGGIVTVGGNGSLTTIGGTVDISNFGTVKIDNYYDDVSRHVGLTSTTSGIFTSSAVAFQDLATIDLGYVEDVYISDGNGDNAYDATGTPGKDFFTVYGHEGDTLTGSAASQVAFNTPPFL